MAHLTPLLYFLVLFAIAIVVGTFGTLPRFVATVRVHLRADEHS